MKKTFLALVAVFSALQPVFAASVPRVIRADILEGNGNLVTNPSFEDGNFKRGWTEVAISASGSSSTKHVDGTKAYSATTTATAGRVFSQDIFITNAQAAGLVGMILEASAYIGTGVETQLQWCVDLETSGVFSTYDCVDLAPTDGVMKRYGVNFQVSPQTTRIRIYINNTAAIANSFQMDRVRVDEAQNIGTVQQPSVVASYRFNNTCSFVVSTTSYTNVGTDNDCSAVTVVSGAGVTMSPTTLSWTMNVEPGIYVVRANFGVNDSGGNTFAAFSVFDGTNRSGIIGGGVNVSGQSGAGASTESVFNYTSGGSKTFNIQGRSDVAGQGATIYSDGTGTITIYRYPLSGMILTSNPVLFYPTYSARVSSTGAVSAETNDWISGNCTNATPRVCTLVTGIFSATPNCWMTAQVGGARIPGVSASSSTSISITTLDDTGAASQVDVVLSCQSTTPQTVPAPQFSNSVTTGSGSESRFERFSITNTSADQTAPGAGAIMLRNSSYAGFTVSRTAAGNYDVSNWTDRWSARPVCNCSSGSSGSQMTCNVAYGATTINIQTRRRDDALIDNWADVLCVGPR